MIKALFITTVMGSLLTLIITLLKPVTKKYFGYNYHYYIWLCVLLVMVTPVKFNIPIKNNIILPAYTEKILLLGENNAFTTAPNETFNISENQITSDEEQNDWKKYVPRILFLIYISGFVLMMLVNIIGYIRLNYIIKNNAKAVPCPDIKNYTDRNIKVYASKELSSPFIIGVFKPRLIIPDCTLSDLQIKNILSHEITHLKRWDILYKWFAVLVKCVHWFNPIVYYVEKEINIECEISCDLTVVSKMDSKKEMEYIDTIISLLKNMKPIKITTQMTGSNKDLKRRFSMIKNKKNISSKNKVLSVILAVILFITTLLTSGVLASDFKNSQHTIKVKDKGNIIALSNKPFYENGTIYLPLRELCEKLQLSEYINWDNGKVDFCFIEYDDTKKLH